MARPRGSRGCCIAAVNKIVYYSHPHYKLHYAQDTKKIQETIRCNKGVTQCSQAFMYHKIRFILTKYQKEMTFLSDLS